jgi:hypothetical protein
MAPELWDPVTGEEQEITTWREENGRTFIPLYLEPEGSRFIVFRKKSLARHVVKPSGDSRLILPATQPGKVLPITGPWQISFDTAWGGPARVQTDTLQSWTAFADAGIKYYSGTAVYRKNFTVGGDHLKGTKAVLDLGNVLEMASITLNGHKMPVRWCAPFQFDITSCIHAGDNHLEVEVVNLWPNRLIGDSRLPQGQRRTRTNIKKFEEPGAEKYLRVSGLLGPVMVRFYPAGSVR